MGTEWRETGEQHQEPGCMGCDCGDFSDRLMLCELCVEAYDETVAAERAIDAAIDAAREEAAE